MQYCVQQLFCTVQCMHINRPTVFWIGFCLTGPISLCVDSFLCTYYFVYIACMCSIVRGEVDLVGLKPIRRTSFSALTLLVGLFDP